MKLLICSFIFLLINAIYFLKRYKITNFLLLTFLCIWIFVFTTLIFLNHKALDYVTLSGIFIIFLHIIILILGNLFFLTWTKKVLNVKLYLFQMKIDRIYVFLFVLVFFGIYMFLSRVNLLEVLMNQEIANLRGDLLSHEIVLPKIVTIFLNFFYPFSIISALYCLRDPRKMLFLFGSFVSFILFSLLSGGKGGIITLTVLLFGAIIFMVKENFIKFDKRLQLITIVCVCSIVLFIVFINSTRGPGSEKNVDVFVTYFSNSVPAFCQLLNQKNWVFLDFNINDHTIFRTCSGVFGNSVEWAMDKNIVWVPPNGFNVFTSFADSVYSLGLIGSFIYYFLIGIIMSYASAKTKSINRIFLFSILFLFSFMSFFVDVFYFMAGSWYCILMYLLIKIGLPDVRNKFC